MARPRAARDHGEPALLVRPSELARFWELHVKTIHGWIREGRLSAVRTPGGQFRLRAPDLRAFCAKASLPVPPSVAPAIRRVLIIAEGAGLLRGLQAISAAGVEIETRADAFEGLFAAVARPPRLLIIDASALGASIERSVRALRRTTATSTLPILVFNAPSAAKAEALVDAGATHALARTRPAELGGLIAEMLSG